MLYQNLELKHSFIVLAHKESPFLDSCLWSLRNQKTGSNIFIAARKESKFLLDLSKKHNVKFLANPSPAESIVDDWNFAVQLTDSDYVTLAHQDDIYSPNFLLDIMTGDQDFLIAFSDYFELRNDKVIRSSINLFIKRLLLLPFWIKNPLSQSFLKHVILRFGSPICCPSVTFNRKKIGKIEFNPHLRINMDWDMWLDLAETPGSFKFVPRCMVKHRIHGDSETSSGLSDNRRQLEDLMIFERLWGKWGHVPAFFYQLSYRSN